MSAAANSAAPEPLELEIYSLSFRLRAPRDEHERLQRAAHHVDSVMRELVAGQPSADTTRLAIQAAFLIASDYFRNMDENFAGGTDSNKAMHRVDDILRGLDIALSGMNSALRAAAPQTSAPVASPPPALLEPEPEPEPEAAPEPEPQYAEEPQEKARDE